VDTGWANIGLRVSIVWACSRLFLAGFAFLYFCPSTSACFRLYPREYDSHQKHVRGLSLAACAGKISWMYSFAIALFT